MGIVRWTWVALALVPALIGCAAKPNAQAQADAAAAGAAVPVGVGTAAPASTGRCTWVNGYRRSDGTYVKGHERCK